MEVLRNARCANCDTRLDGPYCHNCGQREEPRVPTLRSLFGEVTNALFGLESKLWRSIWTLIVRPGVLTQEYLSGKRQKYTTPFRLYLILSIMVFALLAFLGNNAEININGSSDQNQISQQQSPVEDTGVMGPSEDDAGSKTRGSSLKAEDVNISFLDQEQKEHLSSHLNKVTEQIGADIEAGKVKEVMAHFLAPLPKALLIFLPFVALFFKIIFLGRGKYYLEHMVYLLHNHAFLFAVLLLTLGLNQLTDKFEALNTPVFWFTLFIWLAYVPYYFYRSIRRVYESSRFVTILYWVLIFFAYVFLFSVMLTLSTFFAGFTYA